MAGITQAMIPDYDPNAEQHGKQQALPAGPYVVFIQRVKLDTTGYGNQSIKVVYDIADGEFAEIYAGLFDDETMDWRHEVEIDIQQNRGALLNAFIKAVMASNPGYVFDWNDPNNLDTLVGKVLGLVLQERLVTVKRGARKGQDSRYLDLWDMVPAESIRSGEVNFVPPVNDKRDHAEPQQVAAPPMVNAAPQQVGTMPSVAAPQPASSPSIPPLQSVAAPQPQGYGQPAPAPQMQVPQMQAPQMGYPAQTAYGYAQQAPVQQQVVQAPNTTGVYDSDIPF